ncbi:MAG: flavodoxin [Prevotella sp.]
MKKLFLLMFGLLTIISSQACTSDNSEIENINEETTNGDGTYFVGKKVLIAYFSWGGTTRRMAQEIQRVTGGDLFEIVPVNPYPTEYTPCTEVALEEREITMPVRLSRTWWRTGTTMMWFS